MSEKQVVSYRPTMADVIQVGNSAWINPIDHPSEYVSNKSLARTSKVISFDEKTGVFETQNTVYVPLYQG